MNIIFKELEEKKKQPNKANSLLSCFSFYRPAMPFAVRDDLCAFE